jgi:hypothetical protein
MIQCTHWTRLEIEFDNTLLELYIVGMDAKVGAFASTLFDLYTGAISTCNPRGPRFFG